MKKIFRVISFLVIALIALIACNKSEYRGFKKTESGLYYKYLIHNEISKKPVVGDVITIKMVYRTEDTVLFDNRKNPTLERMQLIKPIYNGDINEGLAMLGEGDSATFIVNADSFFFHNMQLTQLPPFIKSRSIIYFDIKTINIQTKDDFEKEQKVIQYQHEEKMLGLKEQETEDLNKFLRENNVTIEPTPSGLYFIEHKKGRGPKAVHGNKVKVHYKGTLTNGIKFDSSYDREEPFEFTLDVGEVIAGWDEGIAMMNEGGKATLIIPSHLAYDDRGSADIIPPYATLVFYIELIEVLQ